MPIYDYLCDQCGAFSVQRPMSAYQDDHNCPDCGRSAPRALLTTPYFASMDSNKRRAHVTNEKNSHLPATTAGTGRHPPNCGCCHTAQKRQADSPAGMKTFPGSRPWMIRH